MPHDIRGPRPTTPPDPLTREEMTRLHEYLLTHGEDIDGFDMLDGFITAVVLLPVHISPAVWYPNILGGLDDEEAEERVAAAERSGMLDLLVRHWRRVVRRLAYREKWEASCCADDLLLPELHWALGFHEAIDCTEEYWEQLAPMIHLADRLPTIHLLMQELDGSSESMPVRTPEARQALLRRMEDEVTRFYRELRTAS